MDMEEPVYIARISYGKDSLKMLDVIRSRGLPLDRITTTDVWATDTISASLPEIDAFKKRMDGWILERYGIPVEHLCARNPDGSIRSYEQMFYHVPKRRSQDVQVERERETDRGRLDPRIPGYVEPLVSVGSRERTSRDSHKSCKRSGVKSSRRAGWQGFPAHISPYCRKLKIDKVRDPFSMGGPRIAIRKEKSWNTLGSRRTSRRGSDS